MSRKKILIVGWKVGDNSFGITAPYYNYLSQFGAVHIVSPGMDIIPDANLLVLPGGFDVDPIRYGERPKIWTSNPNVFLEYFDKYKLPEYIEAKVPVFGICRGLQTLNVHYGGTLYQHADHPFYSSKERDDLVHAVAIFNKEGKKTMTFKVNSLHHQTIKKLADCFNVTLRCDDKDDRRSVEGIRHKELKIAAVQYHPEELECEYATEIIKEFIGE